MVKDAENQDNQAGLSLKERIYRRVARVAVIGLGYVGLPLAVEQAKNGFEVIGIDVDAGRVKQVNAGVSYIQDVPTEVLGRCVSAGRLRATGHYDAVRGADVIVICVPTPLGTMKQPDLSCIKSAVGEVAAHLRKGQLICLESTTFPGTTRDLVLPALEADGLVVGRDFFLAFSPERVDPGNKQFNTSNISKVVGGVTPACRDIACTFYRQSLQQVVPVSSPAVAEMTKIFENTYRAVNIGLVNEFMILCDRMGLDIWEVLDAAATKPFGIQVFYPGPGVGGHCIPVDPFYLAWKAKDYDFQVHFVELAGEVNVRATYHVVQKLAAALNSCKKCLNGSRVLILGVAYKKDIDDVRESPALKIIDLLFKSEAEVAYHDPYVPEIEIFRAGAGRLFSVPLSVEELAGADCVLIVTDHSCIDYQWVAEHARLILDTRNATRDVAGFAEKIFRI
jgi:UDP-N-acetyl-D-glucosamine dehydrogenase